MFVLHNFSKLVDLVCLSTENNIGLVDVHKYSLKFCQNDIATILLLMILINLLLYTRSIVCISQN